MALLALCAGSAWSRPRAGAPPRASSAYAARVTDALASRTDVWGAGCCRARRADAGRRERSPGAAVAAHGQGRPLTPSGSTTCRSRARRAPRRGHRELHVADGSEIVSGRAGGPGLRSTSPAAATAPASERPVGTCGSRTAGCRSCRPATPASARSRSRPGIPETGSLVSFVRVSGLAPARPADADGDRLTRRGDALVRGGKTYALSGRRTLERRLARLRRARVRRVARPPGPRARVHARRRGATRRARPSSSTERARSEGAQIEVPEARVQDAERRCSYRTSSSWRYSIGNPYEEFSFPESLDGAQVMAELGFGRSRVPSSACRSHGGRPATRLVDGGAGCSRRRRPCG